MSEKGRMRIVTPSIQGHARRGTSTAEFALLLAPLTVLLLGAIDFCRAFYAYNTINNCARNGALWASDPYANTVSKLWGSTTPPTSISPYASVQAAAQADAGNLSPTPTVGSKDPVYGTDSNNNTTVTVTVTYNFTLLTSYIFGTTTFPMSRTVTMRAAPTVPN
jgi:Flp pilus assembly protein TadG